MKKEKTVYQLIDKIKFSYVFVAGILFILSFFTANIFDVVIFDALIILIGYVVFKLKESTVLKFLPLKYLLKYKFEYAIEQEKIYRSVLEIIIDDIRFKINDIAYGPPIIEDMIELTKKSKNISIKINNLNFDLIELKISKEMLLNCLNVKKSLTELTNLTIQIPINQIMIRNSFLPKDVLIFSNMNNDELLFKQIRHLTKEDLLKIILSNNSSEIKKFNKLFSDTNQISLNKIPTLNDCKWKEFNFIHSNIADVKTSDSSIFNLLNEDLKTLMNNKKIVQLIKDIDSNISNGFTFSTIDTEKWNKYYKTEIISKLTSEYELEKGQEERIIQILKKLKNSMIDKNKEKDSLDKDISITAMEKMLKLDGIDQIMIQSIAK